MTGYQILGLVCLLYLVVELGAIPLGHAVGRPVSGARIILIVVALGYVLWWYGLPLIGVGTR